MDKKERFLELIKEKGLGKRDLAIAIEHAKLKGANSARKYIDLSSYAKEGNVKIGIVSETHFNSKFTRWDVLHTLYSHFEKSGVSYVLHGGNFFEGPAVKPGDLEERIFHSHEDIIKLIKENFPKNKIDTYVIGGITDEKYRKKRRKETKGHAEEVFTEIGREIPNIKFLGWESALIKITPKITLQMVHPLKGSRKPYTVSYSLQKKINSIMGGNKPDIFLMCGYHNLYSSEMRGIRSYIVPAVQSQTNTQLADELHKSVGGLILDVNFNADGKVKILNDEVISFYK